MHWSGGNLGESGPAGSRVALEPLGELVLDDLAGSEAPERENAILFRRSQLETVQPQECYGNGESRTLVAVHKRMIGDDSLGIGGRQPGDGGGLLGICKEVFRARQG